MTAKQISESVNKTERCVQIWAKKTGEKISSIGEKILSVGKTGKPADYDLEETCAIIEHGLGKNAAALYRANAKEKAPETIAEIVKATVTALIPAIVAAVRGIAPDVPAALPAPALNPRDEVRMIVNGMAEFRGGHREAWRALYGEVYYRLHRNVRECAKNRGMDTLDYIEEEGLLPEVLAIARDMGRAA